MKKINLCICVILTVVFTGCILQTSDTGQETHIKIEKYARKIWFLNADKVDAKKKIYNFYFTFDFLGENIDGKLYQFPNSACDTISLDDNYFLADMKGEMDSNNTTAHCTLENSRGAEIGTFCLFFQTDERIDVTMDAFGGKFQTAGEKYSFEPFRLENLNSGEKTKVLKKNINLKNWGEVQFIAWSYTTKKNHRAAVMYLTDDNGDIYYKFEKKYGFPEGMYVKDVSFQDINKDTTEDLILIMAASDAEGKEMYAAQLFMQSEKGDFEWNENMTKKLMKNSIRQSNRL